MKNLNITFASIVVLLILFSPGLLFAQPMLFDNLGGGGDAASEDGPPTTYVGVVNILVELLTILLSLGILVSIAVFIYGLAKFILNAGNEQAITDGKKFIFWGLITLVILGTFWSIILFFYQDFGFGNVLSIPFLPQ